MLSNYRVLIHYFRFFIHLFRYSHSKYPLKHESAWIKGLNQYQILLFRLFKCKRWYYWIPNKCPIFRLIELICCNLTEIHDIIGDPDILKINVYLKNYVQT